MSRRLVLVLGGARSGKSLWAERRMSGRSTPVTYVAAGALADADAADDDGSWAARVAAHRARRPPSWATVEVTAGGDLAAAVAGVEGDVVVDALGAWLAGCPGFAFDGPALVEALTAGRGEAVVVSEEVGLGVHPYAPVGQAFRDALGLLNWVVSAAAAEAVLVVAGRALVLPAPDGAPAAGGAA